MALHRTVNAYPFGASSRPPGASAADEGWRAIPSPAQADRDTCQGLHLIECVRFTRPQCFGRLYQLDFNSFGDVRENVRLDASVGQVEEFDINNSRPVSASDKIAKKLLAIGLRIDHLAHHIANEQTISEVRRRRRVLHVERTRDRPQPIRLVADAERALDVRDRVALVLTFPSRNPPRVPATLKPNSADVVPRDGAGGPKRQYGLDARILHSRNEGPLADFDRDAGH